MVKKGIKLLYPSAGAFSRNVCFFPRKTADPSFFNKNVEKRLENIFENAIFINKTGYIYFYEAKTMTAAETSFLYEPARTSCLADGVMREQGKRMMPFAVPCGRGRLV
jgi:hypothetical protein